MVTIVELNLPPELTAIDGFAIFTEGTTQPIALFQFEKDAKEYKEWKDGRDGRAQTNSDDITIPVHEG